MKFIINGCHSTSGGYDSASSISSSGSDASTPKDDTHYHNHQPRPSTSRIAKRQPKQKPGLERAIPEDRGSYHKLRIPRPSKPLDINPTPAGQLAAELIWCLNAAHGTGSDLHLWGASLELLPPLLGQSAALQHATKLLTTSWSNIQRGYPRRAWLDAQLYDAALISLQQALEQVFEDPTSELTTTTLAAQTLLQKVEIACNDVSVTYQSNHAAGLSAVISMGGCDKGFSELGLHLVFEIFFTVLMGDVRYGKDSVFAEPAWSRAFHKALDATPLKSKLLSRFYRFWIEVAVWPTLVRQIRQLHENPSDTMLAAEVVLRSTALLEYLDGLDKSVFAKAVELGSIVEVEENKNNTDQIGRDDDFTPTSYEFANYNLANFFRAHAFFTVIMLRILQCANSFLAPPLGSYGYTEGGEDQSCPSPGQQQHQSKLLEFSQRLWQAYPYMRRRRPLELGGDLHLVVAYESGDARQRALTCAALRDVEPGQDGSSPPPLAADVSWGDEGTTIVAEAMTLTGRSLVIHQEEKHIDWEAELQNMESMDLSSELFSWDLQGLGAELDVEPALA
ncbi:hypothetical protein PG993_003705 [Apiospora rasikravindrae]|uniref:Uncharacterized protein n=1 Tax=Apiospora rasikravindrae TaxID=990691 RepID=A0ABR1U097_9PEZI